MEVIPTGGPAAGAHSFFRGGPLAPLDADVRQAIATLAHELDPDAATAVWKAALATDWEHPPVWVHGDIANSNLLVMNGRLSAVLDFGCSAVGDPACDLAIAWTFFVDESRRAFRDALALDDGTWERGRGWALVPLGSIVLVVFAIRYVSDTATGLTYLALVAVPLLAAAALGWASHGAKPLAALLVAPLFALAWAEHGSLVGQASGAILSALSCVTLGVLLGAVTPTAWLKVGIVLMAGADAWLVIADLLQAPNAALIAAHPGGLPKLQSETFGSVTMGYGDLFVAALLGAVMVSDGQRQRSAAVLTLLLAGAFDLLFFVVNELPATVPVALALIVVEAVSAVRRRSTRADATPRLAR